MRNLLILGLLLGCFPVWGTTQPDLLDVRVCNYYKYRPDKEAGREIVLTYRGEKKIDRVKVNISSLQGNETTLIQVSRPDSIPVLLLPQIGLEKTDTIIASLQIGEETISREVIVPAMRHWTVYIYPHSHVDIGYTNTQENVEFIHKRNLDVAMDLAEKTANYPEDARFRWNPEVTWPIERYLNSEPPEKKKRLMEAIKKGYISVDAGYVSTNTSASSDEELLQLFSFSKKIEKETGKEVKTMVQVDIPGVSWGVVSAANQLGISYCLSLFNGYDRTGLSPELSFKPFWWIGPDGKSKVLFLQPGSYNPGALAKGKYFWPKLAGQTDRSKLIPVVQTDNPRANFVDSYLNEMLPKLEKDKDYPYDVFPMTWCMADNTPIDVDLPDAVKSWNEEYAYPHLRICTATEMMQAFEKYADQLPTLQGDYTEYWTDGLGTSAEKTGESREVKEKLVQAEILWSILQPDKEEPTDLIGEAWRNIILSTEHTWAYMAPAQQPISDNILKTKLGYFEKAKELTNQVMNMAYKQIEDTNSDIVTVFNTNTWEQSGLVTLSKEIAATYQSLQDTDGKEVICQKLSSGELVFMAENVPALGCKTFKLKKEALPNRSWKSSGTTLNNGIVEVTVDPTTGDVTKLVYKGEEFVDAESLSALNSFRYLEGGNNSARALKDTDIQVSVGEQGELVNSLIVTSKAKGCNSLKREIRLTKGSACVEFNNVVDKQAIVEKEGIHFGFAFDIPRGKVRVNIPWGVMELEKDQLKAGNRNWIALQRWLNISNENKGITWCSMNACTFESGDMTANIIGGAAGSPKWIRQIQPSSVIYSWALNNHWHTNFRLSQDGKINFKYRVLPHIGTYDVVRSHRFAMEQYRPLVAVQTRKEFKPKNPFSIDGSDKIVLSNYQIQNKGKSNTIRLLSLSENDEEVFLLWAKKQPKSITYVDNGEKIKLPKKETRITVPAKGIRTLQIEW